MSVPPPEFIADYPTGRVTAMGDNLRQTARDASQYVPPVDIDASAHVGAIIMPVSRSIRGVEQFLLRNMGLAERYGLYFVVLCSGEAKRQDVILLARRFEQLKWLAVDGPFDNNHDALSRPASVLDCPPGWDLSDKRNFGLQLALTMGWPSVLFVDDDVEIQEGHFLKQVDLMRSGAKVVASNARQEADHSVVVGAYLEAYGSVVVDSYMSSQAILVDTRKAVLGFYPQIYCEDWFFLVPYLLTDGQAAWAGSIPQRNYNRFTRRRATHEEAGDLLAEGILRLVMQVVSDNPEARFNERLEKLVQLADKSYWEQQLLHRAVVIQDLLRHSKRSFLNRKTARMKTALEASRTTLVGDQQQDGIQPQALVEWIERWAEDVLAWQDRLRSGTNAPAADLQGALVSLGVEDRTDFSEMYDASEAASYRVYSPEGMRRAIAGLPPITRTNKQIAGLESTWILSRYLQHHHLSMVDVVTWAQRLRYDRPIRSLSYNKPAGTIVMVVRAHEPVDTIVKAAQDVIRVNKKNAPIHLIIWVDHDNNSDVDAYREFLLARIMLETVGTNMRLLSTIGPASGKKPESEIIRVMALSYWKTGVDSVDHQVAIVNSHNELLRGGILADLINGDGTRTGSLQKLMKGLTPISAWKQVREPEDLRATELLRQRLLRQMTPYRLSWRTRLQVAASTHRLRVAMTYADVSWLEVDDMQYTTIVHNDEGVDLVLQSKHVVIVPVAYGGEFRQVRSQVEQALQHTVRMRSTIGSTVEVLLAIAGEEPQEDLASYRQKISDNLLLHLDWPTGTFMTSVIVFGDVKMNDTLRKIEALVLYNHWLENQAFVPRLLWSMSDLGSRVIGRRTWLLRRLRSLLHYS